VEVHSYANVKVYVVHRVVRSTEDTASVEVRSYANVQVYVVHHVRLTEDTASVKLIHMQMCKCMLCIMSSG